jgi:hypothetical protein
VTEFNERVLKRASHEPSTPPISASGAGAAALPAVSRIREAQSYPTDVRIIVQLSPAARLTSSRALMGQWLGAARPVGWSKENGRARAAPSAGRSCVHPPTDTRSSWRLRRTRSAQRHDKLNFNFTRDIVPIASIANLPYVIVVHPSFRQDIPGSSLHQGQSGQDQRMASAERRK